MSALGSETVSLHSQVLQCDHGHVLRYERAHNRLSFYTTTYYTTFATALNWHVSVSLYFCYSILGMSGRAFDTGGSLLMLYPQFLSYVGML